MIKLLKLFFLIILITINQFGLSQKFIDSSFTLKLDSNRIKNNDTINTVNDKNSIGLNKFSSTKTISKKHNPRIATKRSLILPGWGQAYNKQYWKIPLVWGALSIPTVTFFYNNSVYKEAKFAYEAKYKAQQIGATSSDSADFNSLDTKYQRADINAVQTLRNAARRDRDYSVFWFLVVWGLNVADATVFGHLKEFDVSENLSLKISPDFNVASKTPALNFKINFKNSKPKIAYSAR